MAEKAMEEGEGVKEGKLGIQLELYMGRKEKL
jgi:hypothetical protein